MKQTGILVYSDFLSARLQYSMDCCAALTGSGPWELTSDADRFNQASGPRINYSHQSFEGTCLQILPQGLLRETGIRQLPITCSLWEGLPVFFQSEAGLGFDLPAALFYLLSRYEEYLPQPTDRYGRFDHRASLAYREGFLRQPLINQWMEALKNRLRAIYTGIHFASASFSFLPTYDIDMAWSYRHKGWLRNAGGALGDLVQGRFHALLNRAAVLSGNSQDPFDTFDQLEQLHTEAAIQPRYFFLVAPRRGAKDKNIHPRHPEMQALIRRLSRRRDWGLHPSWQSGDRASGLTEEQELLESITGIPVNASRQHYLRLQLPLTYRQLIAAGIGEDYSMGYAGASGFRASVARPFFWYDLPGETITPLKIYPFCYMDATAIYYEKYGPEQAFETSLALAREVAAVNGLFCGIWHNDLLGRQPEAEGWDAAHSRLISAIKNRQW
ncbi:hypothetical protein GCM10027051_04790 [Niabella terrae]